MGTYLEKGDSDFRRTRPTFSRPLTAPQDPFSAYFRSTRPLFNQKSQKFLIFCQKYLNLAIFHVPKTENWLKSSPKSLNLGQNQFWEWAICQKNLFNKPPNLPLIRSTSPMFAPNTPTYPPPPPVKMLPTIASIGFNNLHIYLWVDGFLLVMFSDRYSI